MSLVRFRFWAFYPINTAFVVFIGFLFFVELLYTFGHGSIITKNTEREVIPMEKIAMSKKAIPTINEAFDLFIRKCRIKNLAELSISSYEKKMVHFDEFIDKSEPLTILNKDTVDDYILWLRDITEANDITINSYLRSVRAFLYYCMECNYIPSFKIGLIKAEKKLKKLIQMRNLFACWRSQMWITVPLVVIRHGYLRITFWVLETVYLLP